MELLESNVSASHLYLSSDILHCYEAYSLDTIEYPFPVLLDFVEARAIYRERLAVWGLFHRIPPFPFPLLL